MKTHKNLKCPVIRIDGTKSIDDNTNLIMERIQNKDWFVKEMEQKMICKAGRLNRDYESKENVIVYDYADSHIPLFDNMYAERLKAYKQIGYEVCGRLKNEKQTAYAI